MERNSDNRGRGLVKAGLIVAGVLALAGCGQTDPPTPEQFNDKVQMITLNGVTAANGEPVRCAMYGEGTTHTNHSKSWFGFACDFQGTATFPAEVAVTTTTQG